MSKIQFGVPVVVIVFNRPNETKRLIEVLRKIRPAVLYVLADGPRVDRETDGQLCLETRDLFKYIDWPCDVQTDFAEVNLGCKARVQGGLDWVFSKEQMAIILEDDCLPELSFFEFASQMLDKYALDRRVGMVSGNNMLFNLKPSRKSYYFSNYPHIWGWATWARAWSLNEKNVESWKEVRSERERSSLIPLAWERKRWKANFDGAGRSDIWDVQWVYSLWKNRLLSVVPNRNLVTNIGFGPQATHTLKADFMSEIPTHEIKFPLLHPLLVAPDWLSDFVEFGAKYFKLIEGFCKRGFRFDR